MQNHRHNAETSVWRFFVYLQHHVKVLPLNLWSELARSALYQVFAYSFIIMCNVLCSSWTRLSKWVIFNLFLTLFYNICHQCVYQAKLCKHNLFYLFACLLFVFCCCFLLLLLLFFYLVCNFNLGCNFEISCHCFM